MTTKIYPILFLLFAMCSQKNEVILTEKKVINKERTLRVVVSDTSTEYRDKGRDSIIGGHYIFLADGTLKEYYFIVGNNYYSYKEKYDSLSNAVKTEGNPLVHNYVKLIKDSLSISLYFFSLNKNYKKIVAKTNDNRVLNLNLVTDSIFSNMKVTNLYFKNLQSEKHIQIFLEVDYYDTFQNLPKHFNDTIFLHYEPQKKLSSNAAIAK